MTNSVPPDPQRRDERMDELIAVVVALAAMGAILWWGLTRSGGDRFNLAELTLIDPSVSADVDDDDALPLTELEEDEADIGAVDEQEIQPLVGQRDDLYLRQRERDIEVERGFGQRRVPVILPLPLPEVEEETVPEPDVTTEDSVETEPLEEPIAFSDVDEDYWAIPFIDGLSQRGLAAGFPEGDFQPDANITRAQFASALSEAFGQANGAANAAYQDITSDYWAQTAIAKATQTGFMSGYPDQSFRPDAPVTRLEVLVSLASGLNLSSVPNAEAALQRYGDRDAIPAWAREKIAAATAAGLVVNYPDAAQLSPNAPATRAESAAMIYQALVNQGQVPAVESDYVVRPSS